MKVPQFDITALLEGIPHAAALLDKDGHLLLMNRLLEATTGYSSTEVAGYHAELVIRSNAGNCRGQLYQAVLDSGEAKAVTGDIINYNRHNIPIRYTISPQYNNREKEICGLLVIVEDVSGCQGQKEDESLGNVYDTTGFIGLSPKVQQVVDLLPVLSRTDSSVLITGETGTGKDRMAEIIHQNSSRNRSPFVKINCGALPAGLLESELFGHVRGAFTSATRDKVGMFQLADKGTVFLTEIGDMPLPLQVKLLSFLDDMEFIPVGGEKKVRVDVRIIAATHRPLREQVARGEFREDLFYRFHVLHLNLPPLRERGDDIRLLIDHFLQRFAKKLQKNIVGISPEAMEILSSYSYPGNVRELRNIVEYMVNVCKKKKINSGMLPPYILKRENSMTKILPQGGVLPVSQVEKVVSAVNTKDATWEEIERQLIVETLTRCSGNRTKTAQLLHWGRMKLYRKLKHYNLM